MSAYEQTSIKAAGEVAFSNTYISKAKLRACGAALMGVNYSVVGARDVGLKLVTDLYTEVGETFDKDNRFPESGFYFNLYDNTLTGILERLQSALSFRETEGGKDATTNIKLEQKHVAVGQNSDAQRSFSAARLDFMRHLNNNNYVFTRERIERETGLVWPTA